MPWRRHEMLLKVRQKCNGKWKACFRVCKYCLNSTQLFEMHTQFKLQWKKKLINKMLIETSLKLNGIKINYTGKKN